MKIQIVLMDEKDYILGHTDVHVYDPEENTFWEASNVVRDALEDIRVKKIHIRKWED